MGDENSHTKRKNNNKTISKKHTEMSGGLFVPHPLVLLAPWIENQVGVNSKIAKSLYISLVFVYLIKF